MSAWVAACSAAEQPWPKPSSQAVSILGGRKPFSSSGKAARTGFSSG
jgi:hypothetical protein